MGTKNPVPMRNGNKAQRERFLKAILGIQTKSGDTKRMSAFIVACGKEMGAKVQRDGENIYLTKGKAKVYPTFVAHTDTVHAIVPDFRVLQSGDLLVALSQTHGEQVGIGGDDKVGVFLALQMLNELEYGKAAFFYDEEVGCVGARRADLTFFKDSAFLLQGDRRGVKDVVIRASGDDLCSAEFQLAISPQVTKYGRELCRHGLMTDVQELVSMGVGVSALNLSCGYFNPHTKSESVSIEVVMSTLRFMREITREHGSTRWEHVNPRRHYGGYTARTYSKSDFDRYDARNYYEDDYAGYTDLEDEKFDEAWQAALEANKRGRLTTRGTNEDMRQKSFSHDRWRYTQSDNDEKRWRADAGILATIQAAFADGKAVKFPSLDYPKRDFLDWQVERSFCPECGHKSLTLDHHDPEPDRKEKRCFCWLCGDITWGADDIISFWWRLHVYTEAEAIKFIDSLDDGDDTPATTKALVVVEEEG